MTVLALHPYADKAEQMVVDLRQLPSARTRHHVGQLRKRIAAIAPEVTIAGLADDVAELQSKLDALVRRRFDGWPQAFAAYDADGSGALDASELRQVLADAGVGNAFTRGAWVRGVLHAVDKDANERVSWDELAPLLAERRDPGSKPKPDEPEPPDDEPPEPPPAPAAPAPLAYLLKLGDWLDGQLRAGKGRLQGVAADVGREFDRAAAAVRAEVDQMAQRAKTVGLWALAAVAAFAVWQLSGAKGNR